MADTTLDMINWLPLATPTGRCSSSRDIKAIQIRQENVEIKKMGCFEVFSIFCVFLFCVKAEKALAKR